MSSNFSKLKKTASIFGLSLWVLAGFFVAQYIVGIGLGTMAKVGWLPAIDYEKPLPILVLLAASYVVAFVLVVIMPRTLHFDRSSRSKLKEDLAIVKRPHILDFGRALLGYGAYFILTIVFSLALTYFLKGYDPNQAQELGFKELAGQLEYIVTFVALVIVAPIVEELLFRGYLFGRIRKRAGFWVSAVVTSAVFGLAHLQLNVGIDVFALSLVLCYLREKTGALWAGIMLHMIKNAAAFTILFLHPDILKNFM